MTWLWRRAWRWTSVNSCCKNTLFVDYRFKKYRWGRDPNLVLSDYYSNSYKTWTSNDCFYVYYYQWLLLDPFPILFSAYDVRCKILIGFRLCKIKYIFDTVTEQDFNTQTNNGYLATWTRESMSYTLDTLYNAFLVLFESGRAEGRITPDDKRRPIMSHNRD